MDSFAIRGFVRFRELGRFFDQGKKRFDVQFASLIQGATSAFKQIAFFDSTLLPVRGERYPSREEKQCLWDPSASYAAANHHEFNRA